MTHTSEAVTEFGDLVAVVTGGSSGIGAATAAVLRERGARVASLDRDHGSDPDILYAVADVTDDGEVRRAIDLVIERFGRIDILVNNAGIGAAGTVVENDDEEWARVFDVNVIGMMRVTRAAYPHLQRSPSASIVNVASVVAGTGVPNRVLYSTSKGAVEAMTLAAAADGVKDRVRVNAVAPGTADTPWVGRLLAAAADPHAAQEALVARQPMGRLITADEIAHAIAYLASPLTASTTGTILAVDGGMHSLRLG